MAKGKASEATASAEPTPDYVEVKLKNSVTIDGVVYPAGATHIILTREQAAKIDKDAIIDVKPVTAAT